MEEYCLGTYAENIHLDLTVSKLKGTWQRGGFSGGFAEIGSS